MNQAQFLLKRLRSRRPTPMREPPTKAKLPGSGAVSASSTIPNRCEVLRLSGVQKGCCAASAEVHAPLVTALMAFVTQGCAAGSSTKGAGLIELGSSNCQMAMPMGPVVESGA